MNDPDDSMDLIIDEALDLPAEQRTAYLDEACGNDSELRRRVEARLRMHARVPAALAPKSSPRPLALSEKPGDKIGRYKLGQQIGEGGLVAPEASLSTERTSEEQLHEKIGRYKLVQKIGEGGCGVVYLAEQEEPLRRRVALKIIKLGMDTKQVIARFEAERQALALMDHPNIAKVHDGGATEAGRPYFVMELVQGIKITQYCDQNNLTTQQRLDLFVQVCKAIQHAHQKGIIHRDIKPSNLLVTLHDGAPVPKVIDFGIAKAIEQRLTDSTLFTALDQFVGTPAYMSPEQAEKSGLDIDTRSDIYSLGVLLYELLTGQMPFGPNELKAAGLDEMRRIIREEDPVKPSTRLSSLAAAEQTSVARQRQLEPPKLFHLLRGDLDWVVMKCLEKDRSRRYETASGLANEIERFLEDEPVAARPPGLMYRFRKLARRHRFALAAASAVLAALLVGLVASTWLFLRERAARQRAVTVARFLTDLLESASPSIALGRDQSVLREFLDNAARRVDQLLPNQPQAAAETLDTIGRTYFALGDYAKAEAAHRRALPLFKKVFGDVHPEVARSLNNLAEAWRRQADFAGAETLHMQALAMRRKLFKEPHADIAETLNNLAGVFFERGDLDQAETLFNAALAMRRSLFGEEGETVGVCLNDLGELLREQGKAAEAERMHQRASSILTQFYRDFHPEIARVRNNLGADRRALGDLPGAETLVRDALAMSQKLYGDAHREVADCLVNLAGILGDRGELADAEKLYREALGMRKRLFGDANLAVGSSLRELGLLLDKRGDLAGAEQAHREALEIHHQYWMDDPPRLERSLTNLAGIFLKELKFAEAEPLLLENFEGLQGHRAVAVKRKGEALARLVHLYQAWQEADPSAGKSAQAADWVKRLEAFRLMEINKK